MPGPALHRFERGGRRYALDPETCFCFECDEVSWEVIARYPAQTANAIRHELQHAHDPKEISEVIGELEWLRSAKSILQWPNQEALQQRFHFEPGLHTLTVLLDAAAEENGGPAETAARRWFSRKPETADPRPSIDGLVRRAATLLLACARGQRRLVLRLRAPAERRAGLPACAQACAEALRQARLADKELAFEIWLPAAANAAHPALEGHRIEAVRVMRDPDEVPAVLEALARERLDSLARVAKITAEGRGRVVVTPGHAGFGGALEALERAGVKDLTIALDAAHAQNPTLDPEAAAQALGEAANHYANRLLRRQYFRAEPFASLFLRIHRGEALRRADPVGVHELAITEDGAIYPSPDFAGDEAHRLGAMDAGDLDQEALAPYENVGALTTAACAACWARNFCGGGSAAVHRARTGSMRTPDPAWCAAQRAWIETAVAAFNVLVAGGVNFSRMHQALAPAARPSLRDMAKAIHTRNLGIRPLEEADAAWLVAWENWNPAAYFTHSERGLLLATQYDREMDALHPRELEQEFVLVHANGAHFGLLRLRPGRLPETAEGALYFRDAKDYADRKIRRAFRDLLEQAASGPQGFRRILVSAGPDETELSDFLEGVGGERIGIEREALYLHGAYHDITRFSLPVA